MRDILVTVIVLGVLPFVFRRPWLGVLLWTWLSVMNPHRMAWSFAHDAPFAAMAAGATLISLFTSKDKVELPKAAPVYALMAFVVWICISTALAIFPAESLGQLNKVVKIQLMTLVALAVLHEQRHIQLFVWVNALSIAFFGVKGGIYTILNGGAGQVRGPGGFIGSNNEIGLAMLVMIPLLYYLYLTTERKWVRIGLVLAMLLSAVAVLGTQSRGAFLALLAMGLLLWLRSPVSKIATGMSIVAVGLALLAFMPASWHERMDSIWNYEQDSSAMGRINAWETALNVANNRVTGAGFEVYNEHVFALYAPAAKTHRASDPNIVRVAHSIYFQVLGEHGWVGLILFLTIWWLLWRDANRLRKRTRGDPEFRWAFMLAGMCQVALVGYAVGGAFLNLAYFDLPYNLLVTILVTHRWVTRSIEERKRGAATAEQAVPAAPSGRLATRG